MFAASQPSNHSLPTKALKTASDLEAYRDVQCK